MPSASTPDPATSNPQTPTPDADPSTPPPQDPPPQPPITQLKSPPLPISTPTFTDEPMPPPPPTSQPSQSQTPTPQHQPAPSASNSRPPQPRRPPTSRRPSQRSTRVGRPPNINENCLMRRLECVMAVESGRMSMLTACQQYDISARTFYRWLRDKHRLIELTGFSEDDFRNNAPWASANEPAQAPPPPQETEGGELVHDPNQQEEVDVQENLPRLSAQAAGGRGRGGVAGAFMGMKRRFPKGSEARGGSYADGAGSAYRGGGAVNMQQTYYARRAFTKMPSKNATRVSRREGWEEGEQGFVEGAGYAEFAGGEGESAFKRRKVVREGEEEVAEGDVDGPGEADEFANGGAAPTDFGVRRAVPRSGGLSGDKHRIEIMMGRRKVAIAWYEDASAADIKAAIARRFALLPGTQWALMDKNLDEIVISAGVPSGRYTLTVFS